MTEFWESKTKTTKNSSEEKKMWGKLDKKPKTNV